ncbi:hypothetical protein JHK84_052939 [Glycine max]|nr:hypothetical protein JHK84_052939 [Glycine max]
MPSYAKHLKVVLSNKGKLENFGTVGLNKECLHETEEQKLLHVLRYNKEALGRAFMTQRIWTPQFATTESTLKRSFHPNGTNVDYKLCQ